MTTTREEALEQGWHSPVPPFFGGKDENANQEAQNWFRQCPQSVWACIELTDPTPVLAPWFIKGMSEREVAFAQSALDRGVMVPHIEPRPRPMQFVRMQKWGGYR